MTTKTQEAQDKEIVRKSVPLTERDLADIAKLRSTETGRAALSALVHFQVTSTSEGQFLRALIEAGLRAAHHQQEAESYAAEAADPEYQAEAAQLRPVRGRRDA